MIQTQTGRLTNLIEPHKHIFNCPEFQRLSYEILGAFGKTLNDAGCESPDEMATSVHGVMILGYMLGWEQRGEQK